MLHDELVDVLDEHQGLQEPVVDDQVLQAIEEHGALAVVVLDEFLDHLRERADCGRVVEVLTRRVTEPDDPDVREAALPPNTLRILAGDAEARGPLSEQEFEQAEAQLGLLLFDEVARASLEFHGHARAKRLSHWAHGAVLWLHPSHRLLHSPIDSSSFVPDYQRGLLPGSPGWR